MELEVAQLHSQAKLFASKFKHGGGTSHINEAIVLDREALELCPPRHPKRYIALNRLAIDLSDRYDVLGVTRDLEEAIFLAREGLDICPAWHPGRSIALNTVAFCLSTRYKQLGAMADLDEAIVLHRAALDLHPRGHPDRSPSLNNLAVDLSTRYNQLGEMEDLDAAIVLSQEALDLRPQGYAEWPMFLSNLAAGLFTRYQQLGAMEDLDQAIALGRKALDLYPQGHLSRSRPLNNLALCLYTRYEQLGTVEDLDEAVVLNREALVLRPQGNPGRSMYLNNLAVCLSTRYNQREAMEDLDEGIVLNREALSLLPQRHPERSMSLSNLAVFLSTRYKRLGVMEDLGEAMALDREALDLRPQGHPDRSMSLNNLAVCLSTRYEQLGAMQDLDEAIALVREALQFHSIGHPRRSRSLNNLAHYLSSRFTQLRQLKDEEELFTLYTQLVHVPQFVSSIDLSAARAWICMAEDYQHSTILLAYETSLRLLIQHLATLPSLPQHLVVFKDLTSSLAVNAFSACLHKHAPARAVELLEQGRGVFWSQLTRLRHPLDAVMVSGPAGKVLADEFTWLVSMIHNAVRDSPCTDQHERVCHLNLEMQRVVNGIRELPGLSRFLLPLLFSDLQCAASGGPVIIVNASEHYSCDALIVLLDQDPVHIPLQITQESVQDLSIELRTLTTRAKRVNVTRELASFLRKLWDQVVSPIVDFLQTILPSQSRIWWCPTAEFSVLPLHAAGPYRKGQLNLPDLYISSYTSTLTALIRARQRYPSNSKTQRKRFVAIGQAKANGESELFSVGAELDKIGQRFDGLATFTRIDGEESCISRVVEELGKNEWVHLACHGLANRTQPFESAFALHNGHFTIQRIIGCDLNNPEFAYLSACHTTVGDEESPDEAIHLASAMQFAGFRSVIGTMWAVDDGETNKITSMFYKHMVDESGRLDHIRAAFALNKTMKSVNVPLDQRILYIHLGA